MNDKFYPYGHQSIDDEDIEEVKKVLKSDWITQGPKIKEFEDIIAKYCNSKYAVAVSNGTAALHLAALSIGLKSGDEAITSPNTFVASGNCIIYCNAKPVLADIKKDTYNIDPNEIKKQLNKNTKAIIPVDFAGQPCDYKIINEIAMENDLKIILDASHSIGAEFKMGNKNYKTGSCHFSDLSIFSFHPVKHITTGEGGIITTNDKEIYENLLILRTHGITKNPSLMKNNDDPWFYEMQMLGYNYRITDFQCALGISQFKKLDKFIQRRREIAKLYNELFENLEEIITPFEKNNVKHAYHLYVIKINPFKLAKSRRKVFEELRNEKIGVQVHYIPMHFQPYYHDKYNYKIGDFPNAEEYYANTISLPMYPNLKKEDVEEVFKRVKKIINN